MLTGHAVVRMAQRGIQMEDAELIQAFGTEVDDGYLVRDQDCQELEREVKSFLARIRRIRGKRFVSVSGQVVTAYHSSRRNERRLLRNAYERDLSKSSKITSASNRA